MFPADRPPTGGIALDVEGERTVVTMWGEVDSVLRPQASEALAGALARRAPVVIDTSRVTFMDSTGIAFLLQFSAIGAQDGFEVSLRGPVEPVTRVLDMIGMLERFPIVDEPGAVPEAAAS